MTPLLTAADYAAIVPTTLSADVLQDIIDAEEAEMVRRFGAAGDGVTTITETFETTGADLFVSRPIVSIISISVISYIGATSHALTTNQYYRLPPNNQIRLSPFLTGAFVTVSYVPANDTAIRRAILIDLVRLQTAGYATTGEDISGLGYSIKSSTTLTALDRADERERLFSRLTLQAV